MLWSRVTATVHPAAGRHAPVTPAPEPAALTVAVAAPAKASTASKAAQHSRPPARGPAPPGPIEPGRMRRLTRERDALGPRLDLHGLDQDQARARLAAFLRRAHDEGWRAALVITGKGSRGDGVLRRMTPEWLAAPDFRDLVAGVSEAHRRHGGEGALYVALKRRPKA